MALVVVFLWQHYHATGAAAAVSPTGDVAPQSTGQAQGDGGAGNAASNLPADMLDALTSGAFGNYSYVYSPTDSHDITSSVDYGSGNTFGGGSGGYPSYSGDPVRPLAPSPGAPFQPPAYSPPGPGSTPWTTIAAGGAANPQWGAGFAGVGASFAPQFSPGRLDLGG